MNLKKTLLAAGVIATAMPIFASQAFGAGSSTCEIIYGGGQVCPPEIKLSIDKMVQVPESATSKGGVRAFVDNITINDPKYGPSQTVTFSIKVDNNGANKLEKVDVTDMLPDFIDYNSASKQVSVDTNNKKKITYSIANLEAGKSDTTTITGKIVDAGSLPSDKSVVCVTNQSSAATNNAVVSDTAQVCIEKPTTPTQPGQPGQPVPTVYPPLKGKTTPPTGPEAIALIGLIPSGVAGFFLRKSAKRS